MTINEREIHGPGADRMMIFQEFDQLLPWKSVLANVMFPLLTARKLSRKDAEARARAYIEKVGLTRVVDAYPHTLSGGMKQRVAIARGMAMEPDILLMDEPFAALDALTRRTCQDELLQLWSETKFTVLFVTHSIAEAIRIGNRILLLSPHPGRVKAEVVDVDKVSNGRRQRRPAGEGDPRSPVRRRSHGALREPLMGEARILLRDAPVAGRRSRGRAQAERARAVVERRFRPQDRHHPVSRGGLGGLRPRPRQSAAVSDAARHRSLTLYDRVKDGTIPMRAWASLKVLFMGYSAGIALAAIFTVLAISTRIGTDFLETVTAMFNPLPAIALLPLALIWFGLGNGSLVFVLIHSVLWPVALNTHSGFKSVSNTLRMVGRNYGLRGLPYVAKILIPAAFGSILTGLKIGWAFAWRTLIAAELVFGVSSGQGGLGWFIFENRNLLDIPAVFAGLLTVIIIGLFVENLIFRAIERNTVQKWGTQS